MDTKKRKWKCWKCSKELVTKKKVFTYLEHTFSHELLACPSCGRAFVPKDLAEGRIAEVEEQFEDK